MSEKKNKSDHTGFALVIVSHALDHAYESLLPILYPSIILEFNLSYGLVGIFGTAYRLSGGALQLVMGFLGRFIRRKFLLGFGMILQAVAYSFSAISRGFDHILLSRLLAGAGSSPQHPIGASYITENSPMDKLGRALGTNLVAAHVGRFTIPLAGSVILTIVGWRTTILIFSIPGVFVGIAFLLIAESKRPSKLSGKSSLGALRDGIRQVLGNKTILAVMVIEMIMAFRLGARDFIPSYLSRDQGIAPLETGLLFAVFLGSGIPAPYFWGYLSDKCGRRKVVMLAMGLSCIMWFLLPLGGNTFQLLLILVPLGFTGQGVGGVIQAYVAQATPPENRDIVYGVFFTLALTIGAFPPAIYGYLADYFGFQVAFLYVALVSLLAVIAAYFLK